MRNQRSFSLEFKRRAVEELMSGEGRPVQLCRRYNICTSLLYHWKKQYSRGKFNNEPTEEGALQEQLTSTENKISFTRQAYNNAVLKFNNRVQMFPSNIIGNMSGFKAGEFFEVKTPEEKEPVQVKYS